MTLIDKAFEPYAVGFLEDGELKVLGRYDNLDELMAGYRAWCNLHKGISPISPIAVRLVDGRVDNFDDITSTLND